MRALEVVCVCVSRVRVACACRSTEADAGRHVSKPSWAEKLLVYHRGVGTVEKRGYYVVPKIEEMITRRAQVLSSNLTPSVTFRGRPCPSPTCFYYADSPQAIAARVVTPLASRLERTRHVAMRGYSAMREGATRLGLLDRDDSAAARSTLAPGSARTGAPAGASSTSGATRGVGSSGDGNGECSPASRQLGQTLQVCSIGPPTPGRWPSCITGPPNLSLSRPRLYSPRLQSPRVRVTCMWTECRDPFELSLRGDDPLSAHAPACPACIPPY